VGLRRRSSFSSGKSIMDKGVLDPEKVFWKCQRQLKEGKGVVLRKRGGRGEAAGRGPACLPEDQRSKSKGGQDYPLANLKSLGVMGRRAHRISRRLEEWKELVAGGLDSARSKVPGN